MATTPFPGMDPYLELPSRWPDVHNRLIVTIGDQIQSYIAPTYRAIVTPYVITERIEIATVMEKGSMVPDVGLFERAVPPITPQSISGGGTSTVAVCTPASLTMPAVLDFTMEYSRIEIRTVQGHVLVTAIELLSPANKRPGEGADAYDKKRQELFQSGVHLLELDLLRAGKRPYTSRPLPDVPYVIFLSRATTERYVEIWHWGVADPIPIVPVPLRPNDPDVPLDVGAALHDTYQRARYDLDIDYREPPPPPDLTPEDAAWLDAHLREMGVR